MPAPTMRKASRHPAVRPKTRRLPAWLGLASWLLAALPAGALEWATEVFTGATAPLQPTLTVTFAFRNTGPEPVTIRAVQSNCDCLSAGTDRTVYAAGASGVVTAVFTVGDRYGRYERTLTVVTDEGGPPQRLHVRIDVPEPAEPSPRTLAWAVGAAAQELPVEVRVAEGVRIGFAQVLVTDPAFAARLEEVESGRRYRVWVRPARTDRPANAAIRVQGRAADGTEVVVSAYANVR